MSDWESSLPGLRGLAFGVAYRMLGSASDAEDIAQEALLRVHQAMAAGEHIASPEAFTTTITTRLAIDELRSARVRRQTYVGEWLPEPIVTDRSGAGDPEHEAELADSLSMAVLVLLEALSPAQRAVVILRDVFGYEYEEIARIIGKQPDAVRQLAVRARRHLAAGRPRFTTSREQHFELASRFVKAARGGDMGGLETLLADSVTLTGDGGGRVPALARVLQGRARVARTLLAWLKAAASVPGMTLTIEEINEAPGVIVRDGHDRLLAVWSFEFDDGQVQHIRSVINPDKLRHLGPVSDRS